MVLIRLSSGTLQRARERARQDGKSLSQLAEIALARLLKVAAGTIPERGRPRKIRVFEQ